MLLVVDVGNTNINFGIFDGENLLVKFKVMTKMSRTSDEYGVCICELLDLNHIDREGIDAAIIVSVVPNVMHALTNSIERYIKCKPLIVGPGIKTGIRIATENPKEVGADRIVDAVAAYELLGGPVLVLDFGTATTYDYVNEKGEFAAGITAPGIKTAAKALWENAAKLPEIEIKKPESILTQETISSMQAGLVYGQIGQTEYIINRVKKETGITDMKVIATGGLGKIISDETDMIEIYDNNLTLKGLRLIYEKNRK